MFYSIFAVFIGLLFIATPIVGIYFLITQGVRFFNRFPVILIILIIGLWGYNFAIDPRNALQSIFVQTCGLIIMAYILRSAKNMYWRKKDPDSYNESNKSL